MQKLLYNIKYFFYTLLLLIITLLLFVIFFIVATYYVDKSFVFKEAKTTAKIEIVEKKDIATQDFLKWNSCCDWNLILVNEDYPIQESYKFNHKQIEDIEIDERIAPALKELLIDAEKENIRVWPGSGFRDCSTQGSLFKKRMKSLIEDEKLSIANAEKQTKQEISTERTSEHSTGLCIHLCVADEKNFVESENYQKLIKIANHNGFILRYPKDKAQTTKKVHEPLHFRYVGERHASKMIKKKLCLEEYIFTLIQNK